MEEEEEERINVLPIDTISIAEQELQAIIIDTWIPSSELCKGDTVSVGDGRASIILHDGMPFVALGSRAGWSCRWRGLRHGKRSVPILSWEHAVENIRR